MYKMTLIWISQTCEAWLNQESVQLVVLARITHYICRRLYTERSGAVGKDLKRASCARGLDARGIRWAIEPTVMLNNSQSHY